MTKNSNSTIVAVARSWIGTPFLHQGRIRGKGVDCWNLVRAVGEEAAGLHITNQAFRPWEGYKQCPQEGFLTSALNTFLEPLDPFAPWGFGEVVLITADYGSDPKHCGITGIDVKGNLTLIHSIAKYGGCVEHRLTEWWAKRIVGVYGYK